MAGAGIRKVTYNGLDQGNWIENRDYLIKQQYPSRSTFLDIDELEKSGRDLRADLAVNLEKEGRTSLPREFVNIGEIDL